MDIDAKIERATKKIMMEIERRAFKNCEPLDWIEHQKEIKRKQDQWKEDQRRYGGRIARCDVP